MSRIHVTCPVCGEDHCDLTPADVTIVDVEGVGSWMRFACLVDDVPALKPLPHRTRDLLVSAGVSIQPVSRPMPSARPATSFPFGEDELNNLRTRFKALTSADLEELS